tara:strand:- start:629 stop:763 length:135 start_codon:yes stop_codon:yes gene_type:complete
MKTPLKRNITHEFDETTLWRQPKRIHGEVLSPIIIFTKEITIKI